MIWQQLRTAQVQSNRDSHVCGCEHFSPEQHLPHDETHTKNWDKRLGYQGSSRKVISEPLDDVLHSAATSTVDLQSPFDVRLGNRRLHTSGARAA